MRAQEQNESFYHKIVIAWLSVQLVYDISDKSCCNYYFFASSAREFVATARTISLGRLSYEFNYNFSTKLSSRLTACNSFFPQINRKFLLFSKQNRHFWCNVTNLQRIHLKPKTKLQLITVNHLVTVICLICFRIYFDITVVMVFRSSFVFAIKQQQSI